MDFKEGEINAGYFEQNPTCVKLDLTFQVEFTNREMCPKPGATGKHINSISNIAIVIELTFSLCALCWSRKF